VDNCIAMLHVTAFSNLENVAQAAVAEQIAENLFDWINGPGKYTVRSTVRKLYDAVVKMKNLEATHKILACMHVGTDSGRGIFSEEDVQLILSAIRAFGWLPLRNYVMMVL